MSKLSVAFVVLFVVLISSGYTRSQWPLGPGFYAGMNQLRDNLNAMSVRLQEMGARYEAERKAKLAEDIRRSQDGMPFGIDGKVFMTADGGLGYTYNSSDGSVTMYSIRPGSPPKGYMYHIGPYGSKYTSW